MSTILLTVLLGLIVGLSAWGSTVAVLKGHGASAFFGGLLTLSMLGVAASTLSDDPTGSDIVGYAFPFLIVLLGWAPIVGALGVARPGSWWYRERYDDGEKFIAHTKYDRSALM